MSDFKTQQEIWQYVASGGKVKRTVQDDIVFFENGKLSDNWEFTSPENWQKYIEPKAKVKLYLFALQTSHSWNPAGYFKDEKSCTDYYSTNPKYIAKVQPETFIEVEE